VGFVAVFFAAKTKICVIDRKSYHCVAVAFMIDYTLGVEQNNAPPQWCGVLFCFVRHPFGVEPEKATTVFVVVLFLVQHQRKHC
jgi:hypothetical protein